MKAAVWGKALHGIVRLNEAEWRELDVIARWLIATRSAVLVMTFIPCAMAGILAYRDGVFSWPLWALTTIGLIMAHATNNILNDLIDYKQGVDKGNYFRAQYGVQPLEHGLMTVWESFTYAAVTGLIALSAGAYLVYVRGGLALALMAVGAFFVLFYTWPLKYIGLGEIAVLAVWGPLMAGGAYFVIAGDWSWPVVVASLPYALGPTAVLFGKHIDKLEADRAKRIRTLPVLLGERISRFMVLAMMALQYIIVVGLILAGFFSPLLLVVFIALKDLWIIRTIYGNPRPETRPDPFPEDVWPLYYVAAAFLHCRNFGVLFLLGLIGDALWRSLHVVG